MLKQEEIAKRIEAALKIKPWLEARMDRLAKLDKGTRAIGQLVLGYDEKGKRAKHDSLWSHQNLAIKRLKPLPEAKLLRETLTLPRCWVSTYNPETIRNRGIRRLSAET
jgi:hypothetical protein